MSTAQNKSASFRTIKRFPVLGSYEDTRQAQTDVALYILFTNLVLNNYLNNFCQWSRIWLVVMTIGLSLCVYRSLVDTVIDSRTAAAQTVN